MRYRTSILLVTLAACNIDATDLAPVQTGANLTLDYFADTDVRGFHFEITPVACDAAGAVVGDTIFANADLLNGLFPGNIDLLSQTLDTESQHVGSDLFVTLDPGCYDVLAAPAKAIYPDGGWDSSEDCSASWFEGATVVAGATTDILMVSQCSGDPKGGLDVAAILNHAPEIGEPVANQRNAECERVHVCAEVFDVEDNPVRVEWSQTGGADVFEPIEVDELEVIDFISGHRMWRSCAYITTQSLGMHRFEVKAYDLLADGSTFESIVDGSSHARQTFTIETRWNDDALCFDDEGDLVDSGDGVVRADGCEYTSAENWWCIGDYEVDSAIQATVCDEYGLVESALYPECL